MESNFVYLNLPIKLPAVVAFRLAFYICISSIDPSTSKLCGEQEEIDASTVHWDLSLALPVLASHQDRFRLRREARLAGRTESRGVVSLFAFSRTKHEACAIRATGYKSFPNIGLTYRFENSAARKQPICIRITRNVPRDVRLLDASSCLIWQQTPKKKREVIQESDTASEKVEGDRERDVTLQWQFYSAKCFYRCIMTAQFETRSRNDRWRRSYRYWSLGSL